MTTKVELFTSGACPQNPGPGGWAHLLRKPGKERLRGGKAKHTTNNQMELVAVIKGLELLKSPRIVHIITDSRYIIDGMTCWIAKWKAQNWSLNKSGSKQVKNAELWQKLDALCKIHQITWEWVKGQSGHPDNERVDQEANRYAKAANA
ncbi:ribonuclease HI [Thalassospira lohafexi]|uniref:Ribonuclease H n=1 Tax=Thalassospira lohafexi TaxID=744227 RepID=A0A2N3LAW1_9PROT|nr:ribonuclease HI [Thalassospira lohafexi]PKR59932.1 ribonuclease HI [Thalassospira lohafexi]